MELTKEERIQAIELTRRNPYMTFQEAKGRILNSKQQQTRLMGY